MSRPLTTNDVRVLRHLLEHGPHQRHELQAQLGPDADRRIAGLHIRALITDPRHRPAARTPSVVMSDRIDDHQVTHVKPIEPATAKGHGEGRSLPAITFTSGVVEIVFEDRHPLYRWAKKLVEVQRP